jgi:hypothetical protein
VGKEQNTFSPAKGTLLWMAGLSFWEMRDVTITEIDRELAAPGGEYADV